ncbi:MAG: hypothetical protein ABIA04_02215 [Pseudomonadota bacterium]
MKRKLAKTFLLKITVLLIFITNSPLFADDDGIAASFPESCSILSR